MSPGLTEQTDGPARGHDAPRGDHVPGVLREVTEADVPFLFALQLDPVANHLAGVEPFDRETFLERWAGHLANDAIIARTIVVNEELVGHVLSFDQSGKREVGYRLAREHWGKGLATRALAEFVRDVETTRPLCACVVADNPGSLRVLAKCGFVVTGRARSFWAARGGEVEEVLLELA